MAAQLYQALEQDGTILDNFDLHELRDQGRGLYYMKWSDFIGRLRHANALDDEQYERFGDIKTMRFTGYDGLLWVPPLLPNSVRITPRHDIQINPNYFDEIVELGGYLLTREGNPFRGVQAQTRRRRVIRAGYMFMKGIEMYFKMLRYLEYPCQFMITDGGAIRVRLTNESYERQATHIANYAVALYVAIQTGRRFAINSLVIGGNRPIGFSEFRPALTFDRYFNYVNQNPNPRQIPDFIKTPFSAIYWYLSIDPDDTFSYLIESALINLPPNAGLLVKYDRLLRIIHTIEVKLYGLYGTQFPLISTAPPNTQPEGFTRFIGGPLNADAIFNEINDPHVFNPDEMQRADYMEILNDQQTRGIYEMYVRWLGRSMGRNLQIDNGDGYITGEIRQGIWEKIDDEIAESNERFEAFINNYDVIRQGEFELLPQGGALYECHNADLMTDISLDEGGMIGQMDMFFRVFYHAYIQLKDEWMAQRFHGDGVQTITDFMVNFMNFINRIVVDIEFRVENNQGNEIGYDQLGQQYQYIDDPPVAFRWDEPIYYNGVFPINWYNFLIEVVGRFWDSFTYTYTAWMNSYIYKISNIRVLYIHEPLAGGCHKMKRLVGKECYRGMQSSDNNCFFKAIEPAWNIYKRGESYDQGNMTLEQINKLRAKARIGKRSLISIEDIPKFEFNFPFRIINTEGQILYQEGEQRGKPFKILLNKSHYYEQIERVECEKCNKTHDAGTVCRSRHNLWKSGKDHTMVKFNFKSHNFMVEQGAMPFITADIETFPHAISKQHIPYSIAYNLPEGFEEYRHKDAIDLGDGVLMFKGENCMVQFVIQLTMIKKNVHLVFHNGSRYDFILLLDAIMLFKLDIINVKDVIYKGGKIMKMNLVCNKVIITGWDSCLHMLASLATCCKIFKVPKELEKGEFDHFKIKSWADVTCYEGEWIPYLKNDIQSLKFIVDVYQKEIVEALKISPFHFVTISSLANHKCKFDIWQKGLEVYIPENWEIDEYFRKAVYGGRTMPIKQHYESSGDPDDYMVALDVKSLYPYAMDIGEFFIGEPEYVEDIDEERIEWYWSIFRRSGKFPPGIYSVEVEPPPMHRRYPIAFLPMRDEKGSLVWQYKNGEGHYSNLMLEYAIGLGYTFRIKSCYVFKKTSSDVFKTCNTFWQDMKNEAERVGNTGRRQIAKIGNNSTYGKQVERASTSKCVYVKKTQVKKLVLQHGWTNINVFSHPGSQNAYVIIKEKPEHPKTPCHLGIIILDQSKITMYDYFLRCMRPYQSMDLYTCFNHAPYYTDTDSIFIHSSQLPLFQDVLGDTFGKLDFDLGHADIHIVKADFHAPKTYFFTAIDIRTGKEIKKQRTKGFPDKHVNFKDLESSSNDGTVLPIAFQAIQRIVFQKNQFNHVLTLRNIMIERVLNLDCFKKCIKEYHNGQLYFIPFFDEQ